MITDRMVQAHNEKAKIVDDPEVRGTRTDGKFSWTYVRNMCVKLGMKVEKSGCTEGTPPDEDDCSNYELQIQEIMKKHQIDPRAMFLLDEYNDFKYTPPRTVVTSKAERSTKGQGGRGSGRFGSVPCRVTRGSPCQRIL